MEDIEIGGKTCKLLVFYKNAKCMDVLNATT